jgi:hypothetical protein
MIGNNPPAGKIIELSNGTFAVSSNSSVVGIGAYKVLAVVAALLLAVRGKRLFLGGEGAGNNILCRLIAGCCFSALGLLDKYSRSMQRF